MNRTTELMLVAMVLAPLRAQLLPDDWPLGARIPAISGVVVDAISGKPMANLDVTLRATSATGQFFGSGIGVLRYDNVHTKADGKFTFATSRDKQSELPLRTVGSYSLSVNVTFWPLEQIRSQSRRSDAAIDTTALDSSRNIMRDPLFQARSTVFLELRSDGPRVNTRSYFPMAVRFKQPCEQSWNANCIRFDETDNVRVPLIPVFDDPGSCVQIRDQDLAARCRQLNTYRLAFLRRDSALCARVNEEYAAKNCVEMLQIYTRNPQLFNR